MKKWILFLALIFPTLLFGQGETIRRPISATNSTQLNGKDAAFYGDTLTDQNIFGIKIFKTSLQIGDSLFLSFFDTVYKESLNERDFATSTKWITTGNFSISGGKATFSGTSGTLSQIENRLALTGLGNSRYRFIYTVSNMTGVGCVAFINTDFASSNVNLVLVNATDTLTFTSNNDPTDFKIECTCTSGGFDLDDFSLKKKSDSIVFIKNDLYAGGIFVEGSSAFSGDVQILGNLKGGSPLTISTPIGEIEIDGDIHLIKDEKNWTIGIDTSDADQFKISNDNTLGINDRLVIDTLGNISIDKSLGIGITPVAGTRLTLPTEDDAVTPTLAFGDGNTGFYERVDNDLRVSVGGINQFLWFTNQFRSALGTGPAMVNLGATSFTPTLIPDISNANTGIGQAAEDQLSLIAGGVEGQRITEIAGAITHKFVGSLGVANSGEPQYRLDIGDASYFAINGDFAHIIQHNSAASEFWSIAPRNGGDLDIAVTTTDPRPSGGTIGTSGNAISIKVNKDVEFLGNIGVGIASPITNFHVQESNTDIVPTVEIEQLSTGDAALQFSIVGDAYAMGIDNSDADKFKISYAAGAGTAVLGTNDRFVIDASGNVGIGAISASEKLEVRGSVIAEDGFAKKLFKVSTSVFETAVRGTEYNSPNQHGGLYGTVFRKYFAIPDILSAGLTVNIALGLTPNDVLQIGGYVVENTSGDKILIGSGSGNTSSNIGMHVQVVGSNLEIDANDTLDWNSGECWIDYTK